MGYSEDRYRDYRRTSYEMLKVFYQIGSVEELKGYLDERGDINSKDVFRIFRSRKSFCLIVRDNVHLTNDPERVISDKYHDIEHFEVKLFLLNEN
jgi:hypothetical protein